jgi:lipopolysaccharide export system permease protein
MIISRYLIKEVCYALLAVTLVLLLVFLSNQLVRFLNYAASGKIPANVLLQVMGFEVSFLLALLLPLGLYLGLIATYSRLYADNELRIMQASGFSTKKLVSLTMTIALVVMTVVMILTLWINPFIAKAKEKLISQSITENNVINQLMPGRFQLSSDENRVFYVENIARNHQTAQNLFIAERKKDPSKEAENAWTVLSAAEGYQMTDPISKDKFVVAKDGYRYEGTPGQNAYKIIQFSKYAVRLSDQTAETTRQAQEIIPTSALWQHYENPRNAAELQWRIAMPLSALLLALLAIPLSDIRPRQSRYAPLLPAILIYIVYVEMLFTARDWIEQKTISIYLGLWWAHGLFALLIVFLLLRQSGKLFFARQSQ